MMNLEAREATPPGQPLQSCPGQQCTAEGQVYGQRSSPRSRSKGKTRGGGKPTSKPAKVMLKEQEACGTLRVIAAVTKSDTSPTPDELNLNLGPWWP